jgi:hypothetical protein
MEKRMKEMVKCISNLSWTNRLYEELWSLTKGIHAWMSRKKQMYKN